jgi:hypothetical protein
MYRKPTRSFITPRALWNRTLVETTAALTSYSIEDGDYTPDGLPLTRLNIRHSLNRSTGHHLVFCNTGMRLQNVPVAFFLLSKFSHTANYRALLGICFADTIFRLWPLVVSGFEAIIT